MNLSAKDYPHMGVSAVSPADPVPRGVEVPKFKTFVSVQIQLKLKAMYAPRSFFHAPFGDLF